MPKRLVLLILSLTVLTSCGFKLRGNFEMSSALSQVSIEGGNRELRDLLIQQLQQSGSTIVASDHDAPTVVISRSELLRTANTTDASGLATGYDYKYYVDFSVTNSQGEILEAPSSISQERTLDYDPTNELEVEEEEAFLKEEMEEEIVLQILRRLSRI